MFWFLFTFRLTVNVSRSKCKSEPRASVSLCHCLSAGLLQISTVERGVVTLLGMRSGLFVAMNRKGKLYGSVSVRITVPDTVSCLCPLCLSIFCFFNLMSFAVVAK